jgi:hypothetical protein
MVFVPDNCYLLCETPRALMRARSRVWPSLLRRARTLPQGFKRKHANEQIEVYAHWSCGRGQPPL